MYEEVKNDAERNLWICRSLIQGAKKSFGDIYERHHTFHGMHQEWRSGKISMKEVVEACKMPPQTFYSKAVRYENAAFEKVICE